MKHRNDIVAVLVDGPTDNMLLVAFDRAHGCFVDEDGNAELFEFANVIATNVDNDEKRTRRRARPYLLGEFHTGDASTQERTWFELKQNGL